MIARLREIERKCASMGSRSEEFPQMREKVSRIINRLEAGGETTGQPLDYHKIARELFPVAHLFESTGFMSIGKEIAHIERSLEKLAPEAAAQSHASTEPRPSVRTSSASARPEPESAAEADEVPHDDPRKAPLPVVVATLLLAVAVAISVTIILQVRPRSEDSRQPATAAEKPTEGPTPVPTPAELVAQTATPAGHSQTRIQKARLAEAVSQARLALAQGDLEAAADRLSEAGLYSRKDDDVVEIADEVVRGYIGWGYQAANGADWAGAESHLERAERTAMRFGLQTTMIERARSRIAAMERFRIVGPNDRRAIAAAAGRRVDVTLSDGAIRSGRIESIAGANLILNMDNKVGGGTVRFTEEIPLSGIRSVKIYEN